MKLQSGSRLKCMMWAAGNTGNDFGGGGKTKKQQKMLRLWDAVIFQAELPLFHNKCGNL